MFWSIVYNECNDNLHQNLQLSAYRWIVQWNNLILKRIWLFQIRTLPFWLLFFHYRLFLLFVTWISTSNTLVFWPLTSKNVNEQNQELICIGNAIASAVNIVAKQWAKLIVRKQLLSCNKVIFVALHCYWHILTPHYYIRKVQSYNCSNAVQRVVSYARWTRSISQPVLFNSSAWLFLKKRSYYLCHYVGLSIHTLVETCLFKKCDWAFFLIGLSQFKTVKKSKTFFFFQIRTLEDLHKNVGIGANSGCIAWIKIQMDTVSILTVFVHAFH